MTPIEGISRALLTMSRVGFDIVTHFRGPVTDPSPERKEGMHVRDVVTALASQSSSRMPLLGLKAVLKYRRDGRVKAIVRVGRKQPVNIAIRVKGAVFKSDWYGLKKLVARKLADLDRYE